MRQLIRDIINSEKMKNYFVIQFYFFLFARLNTGIETFQHSEFNNKKNKLRECELKEKAIKKNKPKLSINNA